MLFIGVILFTMSCMIYVPLAVHYGWVTFGGIVVPCLVGWGLVILAVVTTVVEKIGGWLRPKLNDRYERKLTLLEQRVKDGKEGVCTIVEVV